MARRRWQIIVVIYRDGIKTDGWLALEWDGRLGSCRRNLDFSRIFFSDSLNLACSDIEGSFGTGVDFSASPEVLDLEDNLNLAFGFGEVGRTSEEEERA